MAAAGQPEAGQKLRKAFAPIRGLRTQHPELWSALAIGLAAVTREFSKDRPESDEPVVHRGRIQAQGGGLQESVSWSRPTPPTVEDGLRFVEQLEAKLSRRQREERAFGFERLRRFIENARRTRGADPGPQRWKTPGTTDIRIDLEIITGKAFMP